MWYHIVFLSSKLVLQILQYQLLLFYSWCMVGVDSSRFEQYKVKRSTCRLFRLLSNHKIGPVHTRYLGIHCTSHMNQVIHGHPTPGFEEHMQSPIEQLASEMFPKISEDSICFCSKSDEPGFKDLLVFCLHWQFTQPKLHSN